MTALQELDHVYAKWEKKGPGHMTRAVNGGRNGRDVRNGDTALMEGKRKWREKYGQNIQPIRQRRVRDKTRVVAVPAETVSLYLTWHN